jgi:regulator of RNase E activity RraB
MKSNSYERNIAVVKALEDARCNFGKLHSIEHHIYCFSEESFKNVIQSGIRLGYEIKYEGLVQGNDSCWQLDLVKSDYPSIDNIERHSIEVEAICAEYNADYDGWGTEVEVLS